MKNNMPKGMVAGKGMQINEPESTFQLDSSMMMVGDEPRKVFLGIIRTEMLVLRPRKWKSLKC